MEPPPGQNASISDAFSIHARLSPALPATSDLALEAELRARLEEIQQQREDESSAMSDRLHALVKLYKKRDHVLVNRYTECLEQASCLARAANTRLPAKLRHGVVDQEIFYDEGVIIRFYPDPSRHLLHGDDTDEETKTPEMPSPGAATNNTPRAPSFSPLSSIRRSPKPSPRPVFHHSEAQPRERAKRPPSPDELALDSTSPRSVGPLRTSQTPPTRKPLPNHKRRKQSTQPPSTTTVTATGITATTPQTQPPPPASSSPLSSPSPTSAIQANLPHTNPTPIPATVKSNSDSDSDSSPNSNSRSNPKKAKKTKKAANRRGPPPTPTPALPCLECRRRKVRCSRARPKCARCARIGRDCAYPDAISVGTEVVR